MSFGEFCPKCGVEMCLHPGIHDGAFHCSAATTEEGEEEQAYAYLESVLPVLAKEEYYREKPTRSMTYSAALWGIREGKRLERVVSANVYTSRNLWVTRHQESQAQLAAAQGEVRNLQGDKEASKLINDQLHKDLLALREENERQDKLLDQYRVQTAESIFVMENGIAESARLRELLQVAEGLISDCLNEDPGLLEGTKRDARALLSRLRSGKEEVEENDKYKCPPHSWDASGERCTKCGDKDWMT